MKSSSLRGDRVIVGSAATQGATLLASWGNSNNERSRASGHSFTNVYNAPPPPSTVGGGGTTVLSDNQNANGLSERVYIGNEEAAKDAAWVKNTGITHIVNAAHEVPNYLPRDGIHYLRLELMDDPTHGKEDLLRVLEPSYRYISNVLKMPNSKVLIHCHAGISRAASISIYYLMRSQGWGFRQAYEYVKQRRGIINPNRWYTQQLLDIEKIMA